MQGTAKSKHDINLIWVMLISADYLIKVITTAVTSSEDVGWRMWQSAATSQVT